jgi:hypothetical protein
MLSREEDMKRKILYNIFNIFTQYYVHDSIFSESKQNTHCFAFSRYTSNHRIEYGIDTLIRFTDLSPAELVSIATLQTFERGLVSLIHSQNRNKQLLFYSEDHK